MSTRALLAELAAERLVLADALAEDRREAAAGIQPRVDHLLALLLEDAGAPVRESGRAVVQLPANRRTPVFREFGASWRATARSYMAKVDQWPEPSTWITSAGPIAWASSENLLADMTEVIRQMLEYSPEPPDRVVMSPAAWRMLDMRVSADGDPARVDVRFTFPGVINRLTIEGKIDVD